MCWHYDICYGAGVAIGGIKYSIVFKLKTQRYIFAFPLKYFEEGSLVHVVHKFVATLGRIPSRMIVDQYFKLVLGNVVEYLVSLDLNKKIQCNTRVSGAPVGIQNQHGLFEIRWK